MSYYYPGAYMVIPADTVFFITTTVIDWVDVFTRDEYKQIIAESLDFCRRKKGLQIHAWVLMTNHLHLIASHEESSDKLKTVIGDFKKFTAKKVIQAIIDNPQESRKNWMLRHFEEETIKESKDSSCSVSKERHGVYVPVADRASNSPRRSSVSLRGFATHELNSIGAVGCKPTATTRGATTAATASTLAEGCKPSETIVKHYHLWQRGFDSFCIYNIKMLRQKIDYLHANPVRAGIVFKPWEYKYCSYSNYCGEPGLIEIDLMDLGIDDPTRSPKW